MSDRYLRRSEVQHSTGLSRSSIYRRIGNGTFPAPFNIGGRCVRWRERDLVDWKHSHLRSARCPANDSGPTNQLAPSIN